MLRANALSKIVINQVLKKKPEILDEIETQISRQNNYNQFIEGYDKLRDSTDNLLAAEEELEGLENEESRL